jgi:ferredoxin
MSYLITDNCITCHACCEDCPTGAISEGDYYEPSKINAELCTECVGYFDEPACLEVCPTNAIIRNPILIETKADLIKKAEYLKIRSSQKIRS